MAVFFFVEHDTISITDKSISKNAVFLRIINI